MRKIYRVDDEDFRSGYEEACNCFKRSIEIFPTSGAWHNLGILYYKEDNYLDAASCFESSLNLDPSNSSVWHLHGYCLTREDQYEKALISYDEALKLDPSNYRYWFERGKLLVSLSRFEEALVSQDRAIAIDSQNLNAWMEKGLVFMKLGQNSEALTSFDKAISSPKSFFPPASNDLSNSYYQKAICHAQEPDPDIDMVISCLQAAWKNDYFEGDFLEHEIFSEEAFKKFESIQKFQDLLEYVRENSQGIRYVR